MITLITGQPGNGKTALVVWQYIKDAIEREGRIVYTVGIPKLTLPAVPITRAKLAKWHECLPLKDPDDEDEVPVLANFNEGAMFVVDEAQKSWQPEGTKVAPDVHYLSEHRHHGLDFVILTQYPFLVHKTLRALVTKHIHIRSTWKGRQLLEWPEWQENPHASSVIKQATKTAYSIPKEVFPLYESASIHTVVKHKTPWQYYAIITAFILVPILAVWSVKRVYNHTQAQKIESNLIGKKTTIPESMPNASPVVNGQYSQKPSFEYVGVVSSQYDWSKIAACMILKDECRCYGDEAERLVIPDTACRAAVQNGWSGRKKPELEKPAPTTTKNEEEAKRGV